MKYLDYREDKLQGTFDFPVAFYHVESNHPRYQMPCHWHPEYEILRILEGSFHITVDGHSHTAYQGDILFIQGGTLHGGIPEDCVYECIVFDLRLLLSNNKVCNQPLQQLLRHDTTINLKLPKEPVLVQSVNDLYEALNAHQTGYEFYAQAALYKLFGLMNELQLLQINTNQTSVAAIQIKRFKDVLSYIEEHYTEPLSLDDMAQVANLSPRYFCRFFRKMTQYTPTEYLNYFRIECACEQLADSHNTITDVALNCGFNDISYFIKAFHKAKGVTPKQYKSLNKRISHNSKY